MFQWLAIIAIVSQLTIHLPLSTASLKACFMEAILKAGLNLQKVHTHAALWTLALLPVESTYRAMTLVLYRVILPQPISNILQYIGMKIYRNKSYIFTVNHI